MRRALSLAAVAVLVACASASPPPGGPEDKMPPRVVATTPDTNAVNIHPDHVSFQFDEVINDRGSGEQEIDRYFLLSPSDGAPNVSWHRSRIDVKPRKGFRNDVAYTVTLLPGLTDLRGNKMKDGKSIVFATGAVIPKERIIGTVFDWVNEKPAVEAYLEAIIPGPDSIRYLAQSDTLGHFTIGPLPPGTYLVRAIMDQNTNRALDRNEAFDTVRVTVPLGRQLDLLAAIRDTLPARLLTVSSMDSLTVAVVFDRTLDPTVPLTPAMFRLVGPDSAQIVVRAALTPRQERIADSLARKVTEDSLRRVDSLAGKPLPPVALPQPVVQPGGKTPVPPPRPSIAPPYSTVTLKLATPLKPNTQYRLSTPGVRTLNGLSQASERSFTTPRPAPPRARPDTGAAARPPARTTPPVRPPLL